jgi:hypothetical protein
MVSTRRRRLAAALLCAAALGACGQGTRPPAASPSAMPATVDSRMASDLERAAERGNVCSAKEARAAGLRAEYYAEPGLRGQPLLVRMEGPVDDTWPVLDRDVDRPVASARWRGWIRPPVTGRYAFHTDVPGATVRVSNQTLAPPAEGSGPATIELAAGRFHPVVIEVATLPPGIDPRAPTGGLHLSWTAPHGARYPIPRAVLFPPTDTVQDAATAVATRSR